MGENDRFWTIELFDEHYAALQKWIKEDAMEALVDEKAGGIIGYINRKHIGSIIKILNAGENHEEPISDVFCNLWGGAGDILWVHLAQRRVKKS